MDINEEARRLNVLLGGGRGAPVLKATRARGEIDMPSRNVIEAYAGENGLTVDEAEQMWLGERKHTRHVETGGMLWDA
jgi:hypothetical protein